MKKLITFALTLVLCCITAAAFSSCEKTVPIDEISIVARGVNEVRAGQTFTLGYKTVPEDAAQKVKVNWEISDPTKLSYKNGEFTALTCGTVKVTASVTGNEATDEIELKVIAPHEYTEFSAKGYRLVYPSSWTPSTVKGVNIWTDKNNTTNMNVTTETLNTNYFTASIDGYKSVIELPYGLLGYKVTFTKPVRVKKSTYLGIQRVQVEYVYSLTELGPTINMHQTLLIFNNDDANLTCVLTMTFRQEDYNAAAVKHQEIVFSQFMPA